MEARKGRNPAKGVRCKARERDRPLAGDAQTHFNTSYLGSLFSSLKIHKGLMACNVEIKAKVDDLGQLHHRIQAIATSTPH